jgi:hypothetical protein
MSVSPALNETVAIRNSRPTMAAVLLDDVIALDLLLLYDVKPRA